MISVGIKLLAPLIPLLVAFIIQNLAHLFMPNLYAGGTIMSIIVLSFWYYKSKCIHQKNTINYKKTSMMIKLIILAIGCQILISGFLSMIQVLFPLNYVQLRKRVNYGSVDVKMIALYVFILAPISEEVLFRGLILDRLRREFSDPIAVFMQAILFAIFHFNLVQGFYTFFIGLLLGKIKTDNETLIWPILFHTIFNFSIIIIPIFSLSIFAKLLVGMIIICSLYLSTYRNLQI